MSGSGVSPNVAAQNVQTGCLPPEGQRALPLTIPLAANAIFDLNLNATQGQGFLSSAQTLYIDNTGNGSALDVTVGGTRQHFRLQGGQQGFIPVLCPNPPTFHFDSAGGVDVPVIVLNFFIPPFIW